jgi:putative hydrolase of the HAD superfamily
VETDKGDTVIKALLFDVDGVLSIGEPFTHHLARDYGITQETTSSFFQERFSECLIGKADLKEELARRIHEWGWQDSVDEFVNYWFRCEHNINEPLLQAIQKLRQQGIRCYIATNQEKYRTAYILDQMGFAGQFDGIFSSAYIGSLKHDTSFFMHVLQQLHDVEPNNILFWDDSPANVATARTPGIQADLYCGLDEFEQKIKLYIGEA